MSVSPSLSQMTSKRTRTGNPLERALAFVDRRPLAIFLGPAMLVLLAMAIFPFIYSIWLSLHQWNLADRNSSWQWVGIDNYRRILFHDPFFWDSVRVTVIFLTVAVSLEFILGLIIAILISQETRALGPIQTILILPMMITPVVVGLIWRFMYNPDLGMVNYLLGLVGIDGPVWLGDRRTGLISVIIADVWEWTPFMALIMLAALQSVPRDPLEAAVVDGASRWQAMTSIVFAMIRPAMIIALLLRTIDAFRSLDLFYVLTQGGPGTSTEVLSLYTYKWGFKFFQMGYAAALAYVMIAGIDLVATFAFRYISRER